jgi:hypothetical protein
VWLRSAARAGFTELQVLHRRPMTVKRLRHYPVYQEGLLDAFFAQVAQEARDHLVLSVLIQAVPGGIPALDEGGLSCPV